MAGIIAGGGHPAFDNLLTLAQFVNTPESMERVKELRDLEASSLAALEASKKAAADLAAEKAKHASDKAWHASSVSKLEAEREAFNQRKSRLDKALVELQKALKE